MARLPRRQSGPQRATTECYTWARAESSPATRRPSVPVLRQPAGQVIDGPQRQDTPDGGISVVVLRSALGRAAVAPAEDRGFIDSQRETASPNPRVIHGLVTDAVVGGVSAPVTRATTPFAISNCRGSKLISFSLLSSQDCRKKKGFSHL